MNKKTTSPELEQSSTVEKIELPKGGLRAIWKFVVELIARIEKLEQDLKKK